MRLARISLVGLGAAAFAYGLAGLLRNAAQTDPGSWLTFAAGGLIAHDAVLVPLVALVSVILVRAVPARARAAVTTALFISAIVRA